MTHDTTITPTPPTPNTSAGWLAECTCGWLSHSQTRRVVERRVRAHREGK